MLARFLTPSRIVCYLGVAKAKISIQPCLQEIQGLLLGVGIHFAQIILHSTA